MSPKFIGRDAVALIPASEDSVRVGLAPAADGGIEVAISIATANLGNFVVPLSHGQVALLAVIAKRLLSLNDEQTTNLRADMVREIEGELNP